MTYDTYILYNYDTYKTINMHFWILDYSNVTIRCK